MPHTEAAWRAELASHSPQSCDYADLTGFGNELFAWRSEIAGDAAGKLETWETYVKEHRLQVALEQCGDDGVLVTRDEIHLRLVGCPEPTRQRLVDFFETAPEPIRDYLAFYCYGLVQVERQRRTGSGAWRSQAPSGSPEVLRELMFKWGPRFRRHRWTW